MAVKGTGGAGREPGSQGWERAEEKQVSSEPGSVMAERWPWSRTSPNSEAQRGRVFKGRGAP